MPSANDPNNKRTISVGFMVCLVVADFEGLFPRINLPNLHGEVKPETKSKRVIEVIREVLPTVMPNTMRREVIDSMVQSFRVLRKDERVTISGSMTEADAKKFIEGGKK